jgi:GntR family transcriptional regulator / MocR family aminotransferase
LADIPIHLDSAAGRPLHAQLADALREAVVVGLLAPGERLPSSRELARASGVSRTVATDAFQQLYTEGWLEGRHGSGTYVAASAPEPPPESPPPLIGEEDHANAGAVDLRPGRPWVGDIDPSAWRRAWRHAGTRPPRDAADPYGRPELRRALVDHLRRARGVATDAAHLLITRGTGNAVDLIAAALLRPGDRVGVEDPCFPNFRHILAARGAHVVPCPVDDGGVIPEELPAGLRMIHVTPAHQYPLGGRMPVERRVRLLEWARREDAVVLEDDYDAEFRYDAAPLPPMYRLGPDRVLLLGSLSKTVSADLGVGWIVGAPRILERIAALRDRLSDRTPGPVQDAVAFLAERGDLERHLRRMRAEYARRRAEVVEQLGGVLPLHGDSAGIQIVAELPAENAEAVAQRAARRGVQVRTLEAHYQGEPRIPGLIIGYGSASHAQVKRGCRILREVITEHVRQG